MLFRQGFYIFQLSSYVLQLQHALEQAPVMLPDHCMDQQGGPGCGALPVDRATLGANHVDV